MRPVIVNAGKEPISAEYVAGVFAVQPRTILNWAQRDTTTPQPTRTETGWQFPADAVAGFFQWKGIPAVGVHAS